MDKLNIEKNMEQEKIYHGAITIFYKNTNEGLLFLVAENTETGNIFFVSGAQEDEDQTLEVSAQRENIEELGLQPNQYELKQTDVKHEFVFGPKKKERSGHKGSYQVFVSDLTNADFKVSRTKELKSLKWMTEKEVLHNLTFPDVKEVFQKTLEVIKP